MFGERTIVLQIPQTLGSVISAPDHNINLAKLNGRRSKSNYFFTLCMIILDYYLEPQ